MVFHNINGIPQHDRVDHEPERAELIFLPLTVTLPKFSPLSMKDCSRNTVTALASIELGQNAPSIVLVVDVGQHVKCAGNAPQSANRSRQCGRLLASEDRAHEFGRAHLTLLERASHPE